MGVILFDFVYYIYFEVGYCCIGVKVVGCIVFFIYKLQMGDQVEIIIVKELNLLCDWLNLLFGFVYLGCVCVKINVWFCKQSCEKNFEVGWEIFEIELVKIGVNFKYVEVYVFKCFNVNSVDEMYVGIGSGDLCINQIVNYINVLVNKLIVEEEDKFVLEKLQENKILILNCLYKDVVVVEGVDNLMIYFVCCCQLILGDEICGYII